MVFRIVGAAASILLASISAAALAQSSVTMIPPQNVGDGDTPPVPKLLDILDTDYPLESLLANEKGKVSLNLIIDADGRVVFGQVLTSSGSQRLDQAAVQVAKERWEFQPHTKNGQAAIGSARIDVIWQPPLKGAYEYQMDVGLLPRGNTFKFEPAVATTSHALKRGEYPQSALDRNQQGTVSLKFTILETGLVEDVAVVETSGVPALDRAATEVVRRWLYKPATLDGVPIPTFQYANFVFQMRGPGIRTIPPRACSAAPRFGGSIMMSPDGGEQGVEVSQWIHVTADGAVDDVLIHTQQGWMHLAPGVVAQYSKSANYPPASRLRRPPSCWVDGTVAVGAK